MKLILTETQYKKILNEYYEPEKLYNREKIVNALKKAPKYIKEYIKILPHIEVVNERGDKLMATKIPETVYQYLFGNF
jgi:hypothetical protein